MFKVGDIVEYIEDSWYQLTKGNHYEVLDINDSYFVVVKGDKGELSNFDPKRFRLVEKPSVIARATKILNDELVVDEKYKQGYVDALRACGYNVATETLTTTTYTINKNTD